MNLKLILRTLLFFEYMDVCVFCICSNFLNEDGKTKAKIILAEDSQMNRVAANLFQSFFQRLQAKLACCNKTDSTKGRYSYWRTILERSDRRWIFHFTGDGILRISDKTMELFMES